MGRLTYQDPSVLVRDDRKRPYWYIRPRVRVINKDGTVSSIERFFKLALFSHRFAETGFAGARDEFFMALGRHRLAVASP